MANRPIKVFSMKLTKRTFKKVLLWLAVACLLFLFGCQEGKITQGFDKKYSKKEIELMLQYHGSLVARFDGKQWWCLQGKRWIKIDSANAAKFARLKLSRENQT